MSTRMQDFLRHSVERLEADARLANAWLKNQQWAEAGRYMEGVLRRFVRNYLPQRFACGTGFIADGDTLSRQCDLIIYNCIDAPLLFNSDEFVIVDKDAAYVAVEVKGTVNKEMLGEAIANIQSVKRVNDSIGGAVFAYKGDAKKQTTLNDWFVEHLGSLQRLEVADYFYFVEGTQLRYDPTDGQLEARRFKKDDGSAMPSFWLWLLQCCNRYGELPAVGSMAHHFPVADDWSTLLTVEADNALQS